MRRPPLRAALPLLAGLLGLGLLLAYAGPSSLAEALAGFDARLVPLLLLLVVADYALRFWRWHLLAKLVTGRDLPAGPNLAVFLAANALLLAPARAGDFTRSVYARDLFGAPAATTATVPMVERIVDVMIMGLLAMSGVAAFGQSPLLGAAGLALASMAFVLLGNRRASGAGVALVRRLTGERFAESAEAFLDGVASLWRPMPLLIAFGLGAVAWASECAAFFLILWGFGLTPGAELAGQSAFIYPVANLAGSLSLLPGGLGVAEGSLAAMTTSLTGAAAATSLAAAVLVRLLIVGFGVVTGLPGVAYLSGRSLRAKPGVEYAAAGEAAS